MNLEDFHKLVSFELRKGSSLDANIPFWTKQAVNFLERNTAMKYMEEPIELTLQLGDQTVDFLWAFRSFRYIRYACGGAWKYVNKIDSRDELAVPGYSGSTVVYPQNDPMLTPAMANPGAPITGFSQIGQRYIRFNCPWNGVAPVVMSGLVYRYSDWQTTKKDYKNYLLEQGSDLLLYQTMLRIAAAVRDQKLAEVYRPLRDEALKSFAAADEDAEYGDARQDAMEYTGIYR